MQSQIIAHSCNFTFKSKQFFFPLSTLISKNFHFLLNTLKYSSQYSYVVKSCVTVIYIETFPSKRAAPYSNPDHWNSKNRAHLQSEEDTDPEFYNPTQTLVFSALNSKSISYFIHSYSLKVSHREKHFFNSESKKKKLNTPSFDFFFDI